MDKPIQGNFVAVDPETGERGDMSVLEESGVAFDPTAQQVDLTKEEKRRTTALMLAIQGYKELIIKDADYLREAYSAERRGDGPKIQPATINAMVDAAIRFDFFIAGGYPTPKLAQEPQPEPAPDAPAPTE